MIGSQQYERKKLIPKRAVEAVLMYVMQTWSSELNKHSCSWREPYCSSGKRHVLCPTLLFFHVRSAFCSCCYNRAFRNLIGPDCTGKDSDQNTIYLTLLL